jgi:hypothetical protein
MRGLWLPDFSDRGTIFPDNADTFASLVPRLWWVQNGASVLGLNACSGSRDMRRPERCENIPPCHGEAGARGLLTATVEVDECYVAVWRKDCQGGWT